MKASSNVSCWFFSSFKLPSFSLRAWKITNITIRNLFLQMLTCKRKALAKDSSHTDSKGTPTLMASFHLPTYKTSYLLSTRIYDLVLLDVCHFHHFLPQSLFKLCALRLSRYSCLHLGSRIQEFLVFWLLYNVHIFFGLFGLASVNVIKFAFTTHTHHSTRMTFFHRVFPQSSEMP